MLQDDADAVRVALAEWLALDVEHTLDELEPDGE